MGICQSAALKVTVYAPENKKKIHYFTMKKMRTFHTVGDVLSLSDVQLTPCDKIYVRSGVGLEEIATHSQFQIRDLVIKSEQRVFKYRVAMDSLY